MTPLLVFACVLFVAVMASAFAQRTAASIAVLFIVAGYLAGPGGWGVVEWHPQDSNVEGLARWALVAVLFTDGMHLGVRELRQAWRLPGRALLFGLPLTLIWLALLAYLLTDLGWLPALLLAAVLTPTDPVFAAAIVERQEVDISLRRLLNIESGMNDGLALPIVLVLLLVLQDTAVQPLRLGGEVLGGVALGVAVPFLARRFRPGGDRIAPASRPLYGLALGLITVGLAQAFHANEYLAAFCAGITLASVDPELRDEYQELGSQIGELLKLATLLSFGALIEPQWFTELTMGDWLFIAAALLLARPLGLLPALIGSKLDWRHRAAAAWFGPKGFASLIYALLVFHSSVPEAERLYHVAALAIVASILAHSSTDVPMARWLTKQQEKPSC